jgi:hypothetical protein
MSGQNFRKYPHKIWPYIVHLHFTRTPHAMKLVAHAVDLEAAGDVLGSKHEIVEESIILNV